MVEPTGPWAAKDAEVLKAMSPEDLIANASEWTQHTPFEMELNRRLLVAQRQLIGVLADFRDASKAASAESRLAGERLMAATRWLVGLTVVLAVLTAVLVVDAFG